MATTASARRPTPFWERPDAQREAGTALVAFLAFLAIFLLNFEIQTDVASFIVLFMIAVIGLWLRTAVAGPVVLLIVAWNLARSDLATIGPPRSVWRFGLTDAAIAVCLLVYLLAQYRVVALWDAARAADKRGGRIKRTFKWIVARVRWSKRPQATLAAQVESVSGNSDLNQPLLIAGSAVIAVLIAVAALSLARPAAYFSWISFLYDDPRYLASFLFGNGSRVIESVSDIACIVLIAIVIVGYLRLFYRDPEAAELYLNEVAAGEIRREIRHHAKKLAAASKHVAKDSRTTSFPS